jgi:hypothetical protein
MNILFKHIQRLIYRRLGLLENQLKLNIQAKMNIGSRDHNNIYFSSNIILIIGDHRLSISITQIIKIKNLH